ncbi:centrosomal protein of 89 kDa isoform X3 [Dunckerocampus dactyliophorus]|uniref:centrosomal protein of 89 kDa isoform X3 n=1 Tax=Dunckerocampus dactyliophorus TaxID=161453 RepID=UPI00240646A1|nr:centrosomal protein of 89 kDa isoform X3 [Dunckerocampus dactyliophorus]
MLRLNFRREKGKDYKHIAHGLIPAASIAPKAAVPRTPPPRSPNPSPERPRSALAAAILSSSLTGQTWALPPARPRSFSEAEQTESFVSEPNISTTLFTCDRWSEGYVARPRLSSPDHSEEEELQDQEEEHIYQTLDGQQSGSAAQPVYALALKHSTSTPQASTTLSGRESSPEFPHQTSAELRKAGSVSLKKSNSRSHREDVPSISQSSRAKREPKTPNLPTSDPSKADIFCGRDTVKALKEEKAKLEKMQHMEQEVCRSRASRSTTGTVHSLQAELQTLRQQAQELVDENDTLKRTVHRLNVELSCYQTRFRGLSKQEVDTKHLSPLMLAYEDRLNEKDALLKTTEEEVERLRVHLEEVVNENERLHDETAKTGGISQEDCHQVQRQALLVLQENQLLSEQLEVLHIQTKADHSKHLSEVSKVSKQLMLLEAENQRLQDDLDESRGEAHKNKRQVLSLQGRLKDAVTWEEHCNIAGTLRRQLEQEQSRNKSEMDEVNVRTSSLQEHNRSLLVDKAKLTTDVQRMEAELELSRQANWKAERNLYVLKQQKDECVLKEGKTRNYLEAVLSVANHISQERDQLLHMASTLQQEKQGFIGKILNGTVRFGKLEERVKISGKDRGLSLGTQQLLKAGEDASVFITHTRMERRQAGDKYNAERLVRCTAGRRPADWRHWRRLRRARQRLTRGR